MHCFWEVCSDQDKRKLKKLASCIPRPIPEITAGSWGQGCTYYEWQAVDLQQERMI